MATLARHQTHHARMETGTSPGEGLDASTPDHEGGWTLLEISIISAVLLALAGIAIPMGYGYVKKWRVDKAIVEMRTIEQEIASFLRNYNELPVTLDEVGWGNRLDPWGNPYKFLNFKTVKGKGKMRKDKFLVPINTDYDLYSMGPDGRSAGPLTAKQSRDDIVRANDGDYVGVAEEY